MFWSLLFLLFLGLQLSGCIAWSWVWVCAPLWGPVVVIIAALGLAVLFAAIVATIQKRP